MSFYALQRIVRERQLSESSLRHETGLEDYEVSKACRFLAKSGLVENSRQKEDRRIRVLKPTQLGKKTHDKVL